jgi:hypothetical protein
MDEGVKMLKLFRRMGDFGVILLGVAIVSSGCIPQAIEASGGKEASVTPSNAVQVTEASGGTPEGKVPGSITPSSTVEIIKASGGNTDVNAAGGYMPPGTSEEMADWWGVIQSTPPGAQYDDYFERQDLGQQFIYFGIDSMDPAVQAQIVALRDSSKIVHLFGTLFSNVPDYNGSQILVERIEVEK